MMSVSEVAAWVEVRAVRVSAGGAGEAGLRRLRNSDSVNNGILFWASGKQSIEFRKRR